MNAGDSDDCTPNGLYDISGGMFVNWLPWSGSWSIINSLMNNSHPRTSAITASASTSPKPPVPASGSLIPTTNATCCPVNSIALPVAPPATGTSVAGPFSWNPIS